MSLQQILVATSGTAKLFDGFSTSHLGIWSLQKERTDYTGYAVRAGLAADSGATTLDIGFLADGSFDMATYSAFGTGSERIVTWYDQSSNGFDLSRAWSATLCPIIRTSSYNSLPCVYFNGTGSLGNSGFTDWNGLSNASFIPVTRFITATTGAEFTGPTGAARTGYATGSTPQYWFVNGYSAYNTFAYYRKLAGLIERWQFAGGAATDALRAPYSVNNVDQTATPGATIPATIPNETGLYINADSAGSGGPGALDAEWWAFYYVGQSIDAPTWATLYSGIVAALFPFTDSNLWCNGDSLTVSYNTNVTDITQAWPNLVKDGLATYTGKSWTVGDFNGQSAEVGADLARILQLFNNSVKKYLDTLKVNNICTLWGGTNDLAVGTAAATALTSFQACLDAIYSNGFVMNNGLVPCLNMLPRTDLGAGNAAFEVQRQVFNSGFAAAIAGKGMLIDVAAIPQLADSTNTTYYLDNVHLTTLGYSYIANAVLAAIEPYIN